MMKGNKIPMTTKFHKVKRDYSGIGNGDIKKEHSTDERRGKNDVCDVAKLTDQTRSEYQNRSLENSVGGEDRHFPA